MNVDNALKPEKFRLSKFGRFGLAKPGEKQGNLDKHSLPGV
ncbi:hypothetical protein [Paenibacillus chitinolyticus]